MEEHLVNLNIAERMVVVVELGDQRFTIRRVVTGVRQLWSAYVVEYMAHLEAVQKFDKEQKRIQAENAPDVVDQLMKLMQDIEGAVDAFSVRQLDTLLRVIELLLVKNGYPFERAWWIDNADLPDLRDFITAALSPEGSKKKSEEPAALSTGSG